MRNIILILIVALSFSSCEEAFLGELNNKKLVVPSELEDLQAILDNDTYMNGTIIGAGCPMPILGEISSDDFDLIPEHYEYFQNMSLGSLYIWEEQYAYDDRTKTSWTQPYKSIFYANNALDGLNSIKRTEENATAWDNVKGSALFYRAHMFYRLAQLFAPHYDPKSAENDPGVVIRLTADISEDPERVSVQESYDQIIRDLTVAASLLPRVPKFKTRPSNAACFALLAKVYLVMGDYDNSLKYADKTLQIESDLLDYNSLNLFLPYPIPLLNEEVIFHINMLSNGIPQATSGIVSDELYRMYATDDIRKVAFFNDQRNFRGSYDQTYGLFGGLTTSETLLIRAESLVRLGKIKEAVADLNRLRKNRFIEGSDYKLTGTGYNQTDLLRMTLDERRREMVFRGSTWSDLRRLNMDKRFQRTLKRVVDGVEYSLPPGDPRYVFLIPEETIIQSGIQQNKRR